MRNLGAFAALILSGMTASCAQRVLPPANIASPSPAPEAVPDLHPKMLGESRRAAVVMEGAEKRLAARVRQVDARAITQRHPEAQTSKSEKSQASREPWRNPPSVAALPPPPEPGEPSPPAAALLPPPPEAAEPAFPSTPHRIAPAPVEAAIPAPPEPAAPTLPSVPAAAEPAPTPEPAVPSVSELAREAVMPPLPEPAEPSFPTAALTMSPPPEPAGPSLPEQEVTAAETSVSIPFPELTENMSLHPRSDWRDVTETFSIPPSLLSGAYGTDPERRYPSLVRDPWPLPTSP
jgi:hypothetical protein